MREAFAGGIGALFGGLLLSGCGTGGNEKAAPGAGGTPGPGGSADTAARQAGGGAGDPCDKQSLTDSDIKARKSLGYQDKSPMHEKRCKGCKLFVPASEKRTCGGCAILRGPIDPNGYCTYWASKG